MNDKTELQSLPLSLKDLSNETNIDFTMENCAVAVNYCIYDKKRKTIVSIGTSRPCGINRQSASLHAEELCIQFLKKSSNINRYQMYIYRYSKQGFLKPVFCCQKCSKLIEKNNLENKFYTFDENQRIISAMGSPYMPLADKMKYGSYSSRK